MKPTAPDGDGGRSSAGPAGLVVVGLVLVAAASRHALLGGHHVQPSSKGDFNWLLDAVTGAVALAAGLGLVVYLVALWPAGGRRRPPRAHNSLAVFVLMAVAVVLLQLQARYHFLHHTGGSSALPRASGRAGDSVFHGIRSVSHLSFPVVAMLMALGVAIGMVVLVGTHGRFGVHPDDSRGKQGDEPQEIVARAAWDSLEDLRSEPDPRRAVVAAYARMERGLQEAGVARRPSDTPTEYLARALTAMHAGGPALARLTALFEVAKFGQHPVTETMRAEAVRALQDIAELLAVPA